MPDDFYMGAEEGEFDDDIQYFRQWLRTGIKKTTGLPLRDSFFGGGGSGTGGVKVSKRVLTIIALCCAIAIRSIGIDPGWI